MTDFLSHSNITFFVVLFLIRDGDLDLVKFLVEGKYCNLEARDNDGQTPAHVAARYIKTQERVKLANGV